jgi:uncharacterized protein
VPPGVVPLDSDYSSAAARETVTAVRPATTRPPHGYSEAMKRRTFLYVTLAAAFAAAAALGWVGWTDTTAPVLRENVVPVSGISGELRVLHVSDLHSARFGTKQADIERLLAGARFDAAVITGDLLAAQGSDRAASFELVSVLQKHTDAVLFVPGNHDDPALSDELSARGVAVVRAGTAVRLIAGDTRVTVVSADRYGRVSADVAVATPLLLVAMHQPPDANTLSSVRPLTRGTQVFLAGHTHGGQIRVPGIGAVRAPLRWVGDDPDEWFPDWRGIAVMGVYRHDGQVVEISPGLGTTIVPFRLFDPAELTVLRLVPMR